MSKHGTPFLCHMKTHRDPPVHLTGPTSLFAILELLFILLSSLPFAHTLKGTPSAGLALRYME